VAETRPNAALPYTAAVISAAALPPAQSVLLSVADPAGDVRGDGSYALPVTMRGLMERSLDLREFRVENHAGRLRLVVGMGGLDNPWESPRGFSAVMLDVYVKTDYGGKREIGEKEQDFVTPPGSGWQRHYRVTGFGTRAWTADRDGNAREDARLPTVTAAGSAVVLDTNLPAGKYSYWVTARVYSPLTPEGFVPPEVGADEAGLGVARADAPSAVDVLYAGDQARAYQSHVLPATGELHDRRPLALLFLAAAGLVTAILATFRAWRR